MLIQFKVDQLRVKIFPDRQIMGISAAAIVGSRIRQLLAEQDFVNMIFAAAPSQNEFLAALTEQNIDWTRINAFHMDEYIGLPKGHSALFSSFLQRQLFGLVPFHTVNYINGNAADPQTECSRYAALLQQYPTDIICMGIGENGHIAFNDPHVAAFNDPLAVKMVDLDHECRQQQVNDDSFTALSEVPTHAITLTIPALMAGKNSYCMVPGKNKAAAVDHTLNREIGEQCPASVLRRHPGAILFLETESSSAIKY